MPTTALSAARTRHVRSVRPGVVSFLLPFAVFVAVFAVWRPGGGSGFLAWYTTVVWSLPAAVTIRGLCGAVLTRRRAAGRPPPGPVPQPLVVVVPTVGRDDVVSALARVVASCCRHLPAAFADVRVDVVVEEGCAARRAIAALARRHPQVRIVEVPAGFGTPRGTRFKARANHYAHLLRLSRGEARDDVWVLHMDDDTGVGPDTAAELARFVHDQHRAGDDGLHLAQGVLAYPREHATSRWTWLADAIRPACDISLFAAGTGRGTPRNGLHGELLLIRASVEAAIGWDFGPSSTVEDAEFALRFSARYPGRSGWFAGRSYGASPASLPDFLRQRERWVCGLLRLAVNRSIPLRQRLPLGHNLLVWLCCPAQHPGVVLALAAVLDGERAVPVTVAVLPLWALNAAFSWWLYWEGYRINVASSADSRARFGESLLLLGMIPLFALWESLGIVRGAVGAVRRGTTFVVIAKPR